jgi:LysR family transcriptional regulator, benzoate and cis,cis-muconate-responsive activator of ben and cat genes
MNRPSVHELECFTAVAEELSFVKAARRLHISQPPLSRHIQNLEQKLGVTLFERNTRRVSLTEIGEMFLKDAHALLRRLDQATETVQLASHGHTQRLDIGMVGILLRPDTIQLLREFREKNPECQIRLHDLQTPELEAGVDNGSLDAAFMFLSGSEKFPPAFNCIPWQSESFKVALPRKHRYATATSLSLKDLADENWITVSRKAAPTLYQKFFNACLRDGFEPKIVEETERLLAVSAMVEVGEGIGLIPDVVSHSRSKGIVLCPLIPDFTLTHTLVYRKTNKSLALKGLLTRLA